MFVEWVCFGCVKIILYSSVVLSMGLFLKSACVLCGDSVAKTISLCESCRQDFPILENACLQCGLPLESASEHNDICGQCLKSPTTIDYTLCLYHYQIPIDYLITELKYNQKLTHAAILAELFLARLSKEPAENLPDVILPVPLHKNRLIKRGFNQSLEIARPIAKQLNIPIGLDLVKRKRQTRTQTDLTAVERRKNIRGCFEIIKKESLSDYNHIVIVDDVVTTGSTANELATLLKKSGVKKVSVWSIARAVIK